MHGVKQPVLFTNEGPSVCCSLVHDGGGGVAFLPNTAAFVEITPEDVLMIEI